MEKQYRVLEMSEAQDGLGIISSEFLIKDPKAKLWKTKVIHEGSFQECYKAKRKLIKTAPIAA